MEENTSQKNSIDAPFTLRVELAQTQPPPMRAEKSKTTPTLSIQNETPPTDEEVEGANTYKSNTTNLVQPGLDSGADFENENDGTSIEQLQNYRESQTKAIEIIEKNSPINSEKISEYQNKMKSQVGSLGARVSKVMNEAGRNDQMPPFLLSMLGITVFAVILLKLNKKFILNFGTRMIARVLIFFLSLTATLLFGGIFFGPTFESWIRTVLNL